MNVTKFAEKEHIHVASGIYLGLISMRFLNRARCLNQIYGLQPAHVTYHMIRYHVTKIS